MDMNSVIEYAKELCSYKAEIVGKIQNSLNPATSELSIRIGPKEFRRYFNQPDEINIVKIESGIDAYHSTIFLDKNPLIRAGDDIIITKTTNYNGIHPIKNYDALNMSFSVDIPFISTEIGHIENYTLSIIKTTHAWLMLFFSTFTLQELKKDVVIPLSEKFDEGEIQVFKQSEIEILRNGYLRNALILIGQLGSINGETI